MLSNLINLSEMTEIILSMTNKCVREKRTFSPLSRETIQRKYLNSVQYLSQAKVKKCLLFDMESLHFFIPT